ncbi:MAG: nucleoside kinase [Spirochaetaceae bacterium]|nr:nucleoside kinase [Spirochaetaceae bacterium]
MEAEGMDAAVWVSFPSGERRRAALGTVIESLADGMGPLEGPLVAVKVSNELLPLSARIEIDAALEPVTIAQSEGVMIYRRSLAFLLAMAARDVFPGKNLVVGHSLGNSYYYTLGRGEDSGPEQTPEAETAWEAEREPALGEADVGRLERRMREIAAEDRPISAGYLAYAEAAGIFERSGQRDTLLLLERRNGAKVRVNRCGDYVNLYVEPLAPRTGILAAFALMPYREGFLLRFPGRGLEMEPFTDSPRIFEVYREYKKWGRIVGVHSAGDLNRLVAERKIRDFIRMAEAFQARKLSDVAARIYEKRRDVKAVLIAGPSSSGKTTTAKRLAVELMVMGMEPIAISLDDYYVGTALTPLDEEGKPDYEALEALDIPFLNGQLLDLFRGREVTLPAYDFKTGTRREGGGRTLRMGRRSVLILEGIHGLNDNLTPEIERALKFKLYVSALTQLNLDDHNRIPTSDNRLLRRMVRDYQFRGAGAVKTIQMWPNVQRGEWKHIFTHQDSADAAFNSALDYELSVLKFYAEPLLHTVKPNQSEYTEASRLLAFLENFAPIPPQYVPGQSILREFIGDSDFKY